MRIKNLLFFSLLFPLLGTACSSSSDDPGPNPPPTAPKTTNEWIYKMMAENYYWNNQMQTSTNSSLSPEAYFKSILRKDDYFSRIVPLDTKSRGDANGHVYDFGMELMRWTYSGSSIVTFQVLYVIPDSPAEKAGIKRADLFSHCNGVELTENNYASLLSSPSRKLTLCDENRTKIKDVTVNAGNYYDTPVICDTVYKINDKNIGYLYYTRFYSARDDSNDVDLKAAIQHMQSENVDELILDLRFNGGGYLSLCTELAAMVVPNQNNSSTRFLWMEYTKDPQTGKAREGYVAFPDIKGLNLNLNQIHIIANRSSASASEILTYCLRQFMTVKHYGTLTVGKNVGSHPISGKDKNYNAKQDIPWELNAITSRIYDVRGKSADKWNTFTGLTPDVSFDEIEGGKFFYQGKIGEYDPANDCDPMLNFVMAQMGLTTQLHRPVPTGTRAETLATPVLMDEKHELIVDKDLTLE